MYDLIQPRGRFLIAEKAMDDEVAPQRRLLLRLETRISRRSLDDPGPKENGCESDEKE